MAMKKIIKTVMENFYWRLIICKILHIALRSWIIHHLIPLQVLWVRYHDFPSYRWENWGQIVYRPCVRLCKYYSKWQNQGVSPSLSDSQVPVLNWCWNHLEKVGRAREPVLGFSKTIYPLIHMAVCAQHLLCQLGNQRHPSYLRLRAYNPGNWLHGVRSLKERKKGHWGGTEW